jgi:hypothetical protein
MQTAASSWLRRSGKRKYRSSCPFYPKSEMDTECEVVLEVIFKSLLSDFIKMMSIIKKYWFTHVVILLVCGICIGIGIGFTLRTIERGTTLTESARIEIITASSGTFEEQFANALKHNEDLEQKLASRAIFENLDLDELTPLVARVEKFTENHSEKTGDHGGWILYNEFYRRWGVLAPLEALKFLKTHETSWSNPNASVWKAWAQTDPDAAIAVYNPKLERQYSSEIQDTIIEGLCQIDPAKALHFADSQEYGGDHYYQSTNQDNIYDRYSTRLDLLHYVSVELPYHTFGAALYSWFHRDPKGALKEILILKYDALKNTSLNALFANWFMFDPDTAEASLKKIPDLALRESTTHVAMQAYLFLHPREAFERIIKIPKYSDEEDPDYSITDPGDPFNDGHPLPWDYCDTTNTISQTRKELISEAGVSLGILMGKEAWDRAIKIEDKNIRAAALGGVLAGWLIYDLDEAASFTATGIVNKSFIEPGGSDFPEFAACLVSKYLAKQDFQQATKWVGALPAGSLREAGIKTAAEVRLDQVWHTALYDKSGYPHIFQEAQIRGFTPVMEWLTSLPPSKGRDLATSSLVFRLRDHDDPSSALKWTATINDKRLRRLRFESLAKEIFSMGKSENDSKGFDLNTWSVANPKLAIEMRKELLSRKDSKVDHDEQ